MPKKKNEEIKDDEVSTDVTSEEANDSVTEDVAEKDNSGEVILPDHKETEVEFLQRILYIQHNGGFGRHLDHVIYERINSLK